MVNAALFANSKRFILFTLRRNPSNKYTRYRNPRLDNGEDIVEDLTWFYQGGDGDQDVDSKGSSYWTKLAPEFQNDREVALAAFSNNHVRYAHLPKRWHGDRVFLLEAVSMSSVVWYDLPDEFQMDPDFPKVVLDMDNNLAFNILDRLPIIREDRVFWKIIVGKKLLRVLETAPAFVFADRDLMLKACTRIQGALALVNDGLGQEIDFLGEVIALRPEALLELPSATQLRFPEFVISNIPRLLQSSDAGGNRHRSFLRKSLAGIATDIRANPSFWEAWFTSGGSYVEEFFPDTMKDSPQCQLGMLNQGLETSAVIHKLIAEYLGVPTGNLLRDVKRIGKNLVKVSK